MPLPITEEQKEPDEFAHITQASDASAKRKENLAHVKRIIGIHSGKGGVGKTFLACNIAYALAHRGLSVGLLDGDVDCPNVPTFLKLDAQLYVDKEKRFKPVTHNGVRIVSMGLTRPDSGEPFLLRGPAKHRVAVDFLTNSVWGELDVLIVDLPPGTSDVPMSLLEFGNLNGILYVTSPQKESLIDTKKSIRMGRTFGVHAIGLVENMSGGPFGANKAQPLAEAEGIPFIAAIPLSAEIFACNEAGELAFLLAQLEETVAPIVDAVEQAGKE